MEAPFGRQLIVSKADYSFIPAGFHWVFNNAVDTIAVGTQTEDMKVDAVDPVAADTQTQDMEVDENITVK